MSTAVGTRRCVSRRVAPLRPAYPPRPQRATLFTRAVPSDPTTDQATTPQPTRARRRPGRPRRRRRRGAGSSLLLGCCSWSSRAWSSRCPRPCRSSHAKHEADAAQTRPDRPPRPLSQHHRIDAGPHLDGAGAQPRRRRRTPAPTVSAPTSGPSYPSPAVPSTTPATSSTRSTEATSVAELGVRALPDGVRRTRRSWCSGQRIDLAVLQKVVERTGPRSAPISTQAISGPRPGQRRARRSSAVPDPRAKDTALGYLHAAAGDLPHHRPAGAHRCPSLVGANGPAPTCSRCSTPPSSATPGGGALSFTTMRFDHGRVDVRQERQRRRRPRATAHRSAGRRCAATPSTSKRPAARRPRDVLALVVGLGRGAAARLPGGVPRHARSTGDRRRPAGTGQRSSGSPARSTCRRFGQIIGRQPGVHPGRELRPLRLDRRSATS